MKKASYIFLAITATILFAGCVSPHQPQSSRLPWSLDPKLPREAQVVISVIDQRPTVETERQPTTDYLYTGSVSQSERHAEFLAKDLGDLIVRSGGANIYRVEDIENSNAELFLLINLKHWYGKVQRLDRMEEGNTLFTSGLFSAEYSIYSKGDLIAQTSIFCEAKPTVIDIFSVSRSQRDQIPNLIIQGIGNTANDGLDCGLRKMMDFLQYRWKEVLK